MHQIQNVSGRPPKAVEAMHDQLVTCTQKLQDGCQFGATVTGRPGTGFGADNLTACCLQLGFLDFEVLTC
ncbi:hypothetical protein AL035_21400 [Salipiger aestuarii]|nr:hypothetical protein AL035_21400 [Salipiger aestuarii]